jgi:hypothetical protein
MFSLPVRVVVLAAVAVMAVHGACITRCQSLDSRGSTCLQGAERPSSTPGTTSHDIANQTYCEAENAVKGCAWCASNFSSSSQCYPVILASEDFKDGCVATSTFRDGDVYVHFPAPGQCPSTCWPRTRDTANKPDQLPVCAETFEICSDSSDSSGLARRVAAGLAIASAVVAAVVAL